VKAKSSRLVFVLLSLVLMLGPVILMAEGFGSHMRKAEDFMSKGEFQNAITEYQGAVHSKPKSVEAQSWLGIAYERLGDHLLKSGETDRAIEAYKNALASVPEDAFWHEHLAVALEKKGDREAAFKEYQTASRMLPLDGGLQKQYEKVSFGPQSAGDEKSGKVKMGEYPQTVGGTVTRPIPIYKPEPPYSDRARKAKFQGTVVMRITIDTAGTVSDTTDIQPLGLGLDVNAIETVRTWKFQSATRNGVPVPVKVTVEVSFRLF
jgi:TonB family protein